MILVTHVLEEAVDLASRIVVLGGSPAYVLTEFAVPASVATDTIEKAHMIEEIRATLRLPGARVVGAQA